MFYNSCISNNITHCSQLSLQPYTLLTIVVCYFLSDSSQISVISESHYYGNFVSFDSLSSCLLVLTGFSLMKGSDCIQDIRD